MITEKRQNNPKKPDPDKAEILNDFFGAIRSVWHTLLPKSLPKNKVITPLQLDSLKFLYYNQNAKVSTLARSLKLSSSAVAQLTDRLVNLGYLKRENHKNDRRIILLSLTPAGKKAFQEMKKIQLKMLNNLVELIPQKDLRELKRIFTDLQEKINNLEKI
jgi:DNA-binding MarR family transcriptional regulator